MLLCEKVKPVVEDTALEQDSDTNVELSASLEVQEQTLLDQDLHPPDEEGEGFEQTNL